LYNAKEGIKRPQEINTYSTFAFDSKI